MVLLVSGLRFVDRSVFVLLFVWFGVVCLNVFSAAEVGRYGRCL